MSPPMLMLSDPTTGFPRVSGDEPVDLRLIAGMGPFSPREWG